MTQIVTLLTLPLKLEHIHHMNPAWKIQANEKKLEKDTLNTPLQAGIACNTQYKDSKQTSRPIENSLET
jgi:hypothetical protein